MNADVALIVLNWNNAPDSLRCLHSLEALEQDARVIVVDNGSTDGSAQAIRQAFPHRFVLETGRNLGYAGGNGVGIRQAMNEGAQYIGILNNDVTVAPDFLAPLLAVFAADECVGVVTPLVAEMAQPERVWALGGRVHRCTGSVSQLYAGEPVASVQTRPPFPVDIAAGAAMLIRRDVFERVGLLDEAFFLYFEETDWCLQVRRQGYRIMAAPASLVWHKVSGTLGQTSPITDYYMLRNHMRFVARHWSGLSRGWLLTSILLRNLLTIAAYTAKPKGGRRLPQRNARVLALRDVLKRRWGEMGADVAAVCRSR